MTDTTTIKTNLDMEKLVMFVSVKKFGRNVTILTEQYCHVVSILNNLGQDSGINFFDPIWEIHRFETGEKVQNILFVHEISCKNETRI
jgi:hypothetical protein